MPDLRRRARSRWVWPALGAALLLLAAPVTGRHLHALGLLRTVVGAADPTGMTDAIAHDVRVEARALSVHGRATRARAYLPVGVDAPRGVVLVHGIHPDGIDEPRLVAFARGLAATGLHVLTPELADLIARRMTTATLDALDDAVRAHAAQTRAPVGLWGISVAGGLALVVAARPQADARVDHVLAIGAHADLARVVRYHGGAEVRGPDGERPASPPHPYGTQVLARAHAPDVAAVSPHGQLDTVRVPVFLLHGSGDPIIPALETRDLAREVPPTALRCVLVTPVLRHAEATGTPTAGDAWALVRFVASVLAEAKN